MPQEREANKFHNQRTCVMRRQCILFFVLDIEEAENIFLGEHTRLLQNAEEIEFLKGRNFECTRLIEALDDLLNASNYY